MAIAHARRADGDAGDSSGRQILPTLLAGVVRARSREHRELRQPGARPDAVRAARLDTLLALRAYAEAIEALSWPVPRTIRLDIQLHQALIGPMASS